MHAHSSARSRQPVFANGVDGKELCVKHMRKAYRKHSSRKALEAPSPCVVITTQQLMLLQAQQFNH